MAGRREPGLKRGGQSKTLSSGIKLMKRKDKRKTRLVPP